jgi:pyridoxamine 5'-phosphate oxidase
MDLKNVRAEYQGEHLDTQKLNESPTEQLKAWMDDAKELKYPNAAALSTIDKNGFPASRIVLIKEIKDDSLVFYTSYESDKASDLHADNKAGMNIYWKELDRQIRMKGHIEKISTIESKDYFYSRPFESQVAALISPQSKEITIERLQEDFKNGCDKYKDSKVPMPNNWGGYKMKINSFEFWQGRPSRLHDRFVYTQQLSNWKVSRLAP